MRLSKRRSTARISISMTPMIDIVFLLIIFFMTLPQLTKVVYHPVELPKVRKIINDDSAEQLTINIDLEGKILVAGEELEESGLERKLLELLRKNRNDPDRIQILVRADGRVNSGAINRLVKLFNDNEVKQVRISARSKQ